MFETGDAQQLEDILRIADQKRTDQHAKGTIPASEIDTAVDHQEPCEKNGIGMVAAAQDGQQRCQGHRTNHAKNKCDEYCLGNSNQGIIETEGPFDNQVDDAQAVLDILNGRLPDADLALSIGANGTGNAGLKFQQAGNP